jgi:uncharacterized protein (DUF2235 family)
MRNIVICCDGTGNEISENISNVLKLYRCLRKTEKTTPRQIVYYDPGVGTLARPDPWHKLRQDFNAILGLATGYGLDDNVLAAYRFVVRNWQDGDRIYLFGFSRGAYTVRVLAGLIHKVGLITPEQGNLAGSGLTAYKQFSSDLAPTLGLNLRAFSDGGDDAAPLPASPFDNAAQFARITSSRWPTIHFVGVWDTVASVIVPRPDRFYFPSLEELAFTLQNPSVKAFRQAIAIDERRCMFRLKKWDEPQPYMHNPFMDPDKAEPQDILQVWFAGVHADIGGGYPEKESGLSKYPLLWMIDEARKCGLTVNTQTVKQLAWGVQRKGSPFSYVAPDFRADAHDSMTMAWRILEYLPKSASYKEWPQRKSHFGFYIPDSEPRLIPDDAVIHESAEKRMNAGLGYQPVNFPKRYTTFPMPEPPSGPSIPDDG